MSGVDPTQARDLYRAAASFYRQAPWRSVAGDEPIEVRCEPLEGGPRFAIVLGRKGKVKGLWLCDDWETCLLVERGHYQSIAEHLRYTALHFGDRTEISPDDLERGRLHGFEVAGPRAFPVVLRKELGEDFRSPDAGELELLEACLWVIPDFAERAKDRKPEEFEYAFKGKEGKMTLDLSWVPMERLRAGRPEGSP
jgi:hypothetical protein